MNRAEKNRGAAMVIVLCVMVVFLALSATILLAGSVALNNARNSVYFERGKAQAVSLGELFARDMLRVHGMEEEPGKVSDGETERTYQSLIRYVRDGIMNFVNKKESAWIPYDENANGGAGNQEDAVKKFMLDSEEEDKHQICIEMYWTWEPKEGFDAETEKLEEKLKDQKVRLFIDVYSVLSDAEYHVKRAFELNQVQAISDYNTPPEGEEGYPYNWTWVTTGRSENRT